MAFLNGLFALLSVVLFILLFVALIKPSIFKIKTRLKAFLIFCAVYMPIFELAQKHNWNSCDFGFKGYSE